MQHDINRINGRKILFVTSVLFITGCGGDSGDGNNGDSVPESQTATPTSVSVAKADSYVVERNGPLNVTAQNGLLTNDELLSSSQAEVLVVVPPTSSSQFEVNTDGSFLYVHNGNAVTTDSFTYQINDGTNKSNVATVSLTITEALAAQNACLSTALNTNLSGNLDNFVTGGQSAVSFTQVGTAPIGSVLIDPTTGEYTYTPSPGMRGLDKFTYEVTNQSGTRASATVEIVVGQTRIMPLGDSITKGITEGLTEAEEDSKLPSQRLMIGYRATLYDDLLGKNYKIDFVGSQSNGLGASPPIGDPDHEGYGGIEDSEVAMDVYNWLNANPADVILLHIGINGLRRAGQASSADVEMILNEIDRWEADTSTPVAVFLAYIIEAKDIDNNDVIPNPKVAEFNTNLETLVLGPGGTGGGRVDAGDDITMVNIHDALTYPADLSPDLVHPLPSGYNKMALTWLEALENSQKLPSCASGG